MNRLKELREEKGLTVRELSEKLNINYATISRTETEVSGINDDYLKAFSDFYHVSTDYILGLSNVRNESVLKGNLNKIKESDKYELNKELTDNELDANLEELLSRAKVKFQGRELTKAEIKAILNTAKSILDLRDDEQGDK